MYAEFCGNAREGHRNQTKKETGHVLRKVILKFIIVILTQIGVIRFPSREREELF